MVVDRWAEVQLWILGDFKSVNSNNNDDDNLKIIIDLLVNFQNNSYKFKEKKKNDTKNKLQTNVDFSMVNKLFKMK